MKTEHEEFSLTEDPSPAPGLLSPRPLVLLGGAAASVLVICAVLLARGPASKGSERSSPVLILLWVLVIVASLLLLGAVSGLLARVATRWQLTTPDWTTAHDQQAALGWLKRGEEVPPDLREAAQQVLDRGWQGRWIWSFPILGVLWTVMSFGEHGRDFWFHLVLGLGYCVFSVQPLRERRRVLRAGARSGLRPRRHGTRRKVG